MKGEYSNIEIKGIVSAVPENEVCNLDYIEKIESRRIKKQVMLTGIENRRVCINGQKASDLATIAADKLLNLLEWNRNEIGTYFCYTIAGVIKTIHRIYHSTKIGHRKRLFGL